MTLILDFSQERNPGVWEDGEEIFSPTLPTPHLTGVGFLQLGGIEAKEIVNRSRRKSTPTRKTKRKMVE
ncbi:hypothetical protein, partial [Nostoc spongiaeforme]|uniref:hypothetical protein n=1 Tax=Nostoc spongiaeforme TaxID=502487 RepID=UPI001A7E5117